MNEDFWNTLDQLRIQNHIVIDRPKGTRHPRYPDLVYPLDYGYFEGTVSGDGDGIDVWIGSAGTGQLTGVLCTYDTFKRDAELKILLGCTVKDVQTVLAFNSDFMRFLYVPRPKEEA